MPRGGREKTRGDGPERKCIATGRGAAGRRHGALRRGPDGVVVPDIAGQAARPGDLGRGRSRGAGARGVQGAFRAGGQGPGDGAGGLVDEVERQLAQRVIGLVSLARKSGRP